MGCLCASNSKKNKRDLNQFLLEKHTSVRASKECTQILIFFSNRFILKRVTSMTTETIILSFTTGQMLKQTKTPVSKEPKKKKKAPCNLTDPTIYTRLLSSQDKKERTRERKLAVGYFVSQTHGDNYKESLHLLVNRFRFHRDTE